MMKGKKKNETVVRYTFHRHSRSQEASLGAPAVQPVQREKISRPLLFAAAINPSWRPDTAAVIPHHN